MRFIFEAELAAARKRIAEQEHTIEVLNTTIRLYQDERQIRFDTPIKGQAVAS